MFRTQAPYPVALGRALSAPLLVAWLAAPSARAEVSTPPTPESLQPAPEVARSLSIETSFDTSAFLRSSSDFAQASSTLTFKPKGERRGPSLFARVDAEAKVFMSDMKTVGYEVTEVFVATGTGFAPGHQLTIGRRLYDWSVADKAWSLGVWTPRFEWDPLRPELIGRTGVFYSFESPQWQVHFHAAPVSVPEKGYPIEAQNGRLVSPSPFWRPPPDAVEQDGLAIPIQYGLKYPSVSRILLQPGAAISGRYGQKTGEWGSVSYAYLPIKQAVVAVEPQLQFDNQLSLLATVHPLFPYHHLMTLEGGYQEESWSSWASATREIPIPENLPAGWYATPIGPSWLASVGGSFVPTPGLTLSSSYLYSHEEADTSSAPVFLPKFPSRFSYRSAGMLTAHWQATERLSHEGRVTHDFDQNATVLSFDGLLQPRPGATGGSLAGWKLGLGVDFIFSGANDGQIGQFVGKDRVRWTMAYAF